MPAISSSERASVKLGALGGIAEVPRVSTGHAGFAAAPLQPWWLRKYTQWDRDYAD